MFWDIEYKHFMRDIFPPVAADIIKEKMEAAGLDPAGVSDEHESIINEVYSWGAHSPMDRFDEKESLDFSSAPAEYRVRLAGSALANIDSLSVYGTNRTELVSRLVDEIEGFVDEYDLDKEDGEVDEFATEDAEDYTATKENKNIPTTLYLASYDTKYGAFSGVFLTKKEAEEDVLEKARDFLQVDVEITAFKDVVEITEKMGIDCPFAFNINSVVLGRNPDANTATEDLTATKEKIKNFTNFLINDGYSKEDIDDISRTGKIDERRVWGLGDGADEHNDILQRASFNNFNWCEDSEGYLIATIGEEELNSLLSSHLLKRREISIFDKGSIREVALSSNKDLTHTLTVHKEHFKQIVGYGNGKPTIDDSVEKMSDSEREAAMDEIEGKSDRNIDLTQ